MNFPHPSEVFSVAISPDGSLLASGSSDGTVRVWQVETGTLANEMEHGDISIRCIAFSPDGTILASGTNDGRIYLWRMRDGLLLNTLKAHAVSIGSLVFAPDGASLASAAPDSSVKLWNMNDGGMQQCFVATGADVISVTFSFQDTIIAIGNDIDEMWLEEWDLPEGVVVNMWVEPKAHASNAALAPVSGIVAIAHGNSIETLRIKDGKQLIIQVGPTLTNVVKMAYSPDGQILAAGTSDGSVWLWPTQP